VSGLTYDSGALIAAERGERQMWLIHQRALMRGVRPVVPAGVVVEVYRSARQASLARLLRGCQVDSLDERTAKAAGMLLGRCAKDKGGLDPGAVDASVAEGALRRGDAVVTGNASHLRALADGAHRKLDVIPV
jgi:predicted nucleic acid-binding protein